MGAGGGGGCSLWIWQVQFGPLSLLPLGIVGVSGSGAFGLLGSGLEMSGLSVGVVWWSLFFLFFDLTLMVSTWWGWGIRAGPIGSVENPTPILLHARL